VADTRKREYTRPDGWRIGQRLARKARPAGRLSTVLDDALDELADLDDVRRYRRAAA